MVGSAAGYRVAAGRRSARPTIDAVAISSPSNAIEAVPETP